LINNDQHDMGRSGQYSLLTFMPESTKWTSVVIL